MFGRVPGTRPNISESHSEISTRAPFCIVSQTKGQGTRPDGLATDARLGELHVLDDVLVEMVADHEHVEVLVHRVDLGVLAPGFQPQRRGPRSQDRLQHCA